MPRQLEECWSSLGWQRELAESLARPDCSCSEVVVASDVPRTFSVPFSGRRPETKSYVFSKPIVGDLSSPVSKPSSSKAGARPQASRNQGVTRIQPPRDVIKLSDRLFYLLQPPLETLFQNTILDLPFEPFDFQYAGVGFLFPRAHAVLADEMGLGKTMQCITTIRMLIRSRHVRTVLLVCPKPLVSNWQREIQLWAPELPVSIITGHQDKRRWHWEQDQTPVKIANYELLVRDAEVVQNLQQEFDLVVVDEAQRIKNKASATSQVIRSIRRRRSWALTGTPIENGVEDLLGIFEFVAPGLIHPVMSHRELKHEVSDYVLRRTKDMVIQDMPPKLIRDAELSLSGEQAATYEQAESDGVIRLSEMGDQITVKHVFELVLRLKQICNFDPPTGTSSKMELLAADLEEVAASGQKAIVFSQWVGTLEKIADHLLAYNPLMFHGRIASSKRDRVLAEFKDSPDRHVLLMSYGAGAVGLNLQFCRYVYLFDRWWNPAVEDQAINRAHRIGAAGSVTVTRMIMAGTIEQRIHEILEAKRELFNEILSDQPAPGNRGLTRDEIFGLFNLQTPERTICRAA